MIVVIEGLTNAGKTTVCKSVEAGLRKRNISSQTLATTNDLVVSAVSQITNPKEHVDAIDARSELMLYLAILSRKCDLITNVMRATPFDVLLVDRLALSVLCFFVYVRALPRDAVKACVDVARNGLTPDLTFFLDVSFETSKARSGNSPFSRKDIGIEHYWDTLREGFLNELNQFTSLAYMVPGGNQNPEALADQLISFIEKARPMRRQM
jgi:dTMP kinase